MLHPLKKDAILQWYNSLTAKGSAQSLEQFTDGTNFLEIVQHVYPDLKLMINEEESSPEEDKNILIIKKYDLIKKFIDDYFHLDSQGLIQYDSCWAKKDMELAKVAVILLSALVQKYLSDENILLDTTALLDNRIQEEIKECMSLLLERTAKDGPLRKAEFQRVLSRPAKFKGSDRKSRPFESKRKKSSDVSVLDRKSPSRGKKRSDRSFIITEDILESPVKNYLDSPKVQYQTIVVMKETEIRKLRCDLYNEESKTASLSSMNDELLKNIEKLEREIKTLKTRCNSAEEDVEDKENQNQIDFGTFEEDNKKLLQTVKEYEEEIENLKLESQNRLDRIDEFEKKLEEIKSEPKTPDPRVKELEDKIVEEQDRFQEDAAMMLEQIIAAQNEAAVYKEMLREEKDKQKPLPSSPNSENIVPYEYEAIVMEKDQSNAKLKEQIATFIQKNQEFQCIDCQLSFPQWVSASGLEVEDLPGISLTMPSQQQSSQSTLPATPVGRLWANYSSPEADTQASPTFTCDGLERKQIRQLALAVIANVNRSEEDPELTRLAHQQMDCPADVIALLKLLSEALISLKAPPASAPEGTTGRRGRPKLSAVSDTARMKHQIQVLESEREKKEKDVIESLAKKEMEVKERVKEIKEYKEKYQKLVQRLKKMQEEKKKEIDAEVRYESEKHEKNSIFRELVDTRDALDRERNTNENLRSEIENCSKCAKLFRKATELKKERNNFEGELKTSQYKVNQLTARIKSLEGQVKDICEQKDKLQLKRKVEEVFTRGTSQAERRELIEAHLRAAMPPRTKTTQCDIDGEAKLKKLKGGSTTSFVLQKVRKDGQNESAISFTNKSVRGSAFQGEDEEDFLNHSSLAQIQQAEPTGNRLSELQRRNTLCLPHLKSSYPLEIQNMTPNERKYYVGSIRPTTSSESYQQSAQDTFTVHRGSNESLQDGLVSRSKKAKLCETESESPSRSGRVLSNVLGRLTPKGRKVGVLSSTRRKFRTPESILRLVRHSRKDKLN